MTLSTKVAEPIANMLELDRLGRFAGIGAVTVLSILMLVIVSFAGGLVARTKLGGRITGWLEGSLLANIPYYQMIKSMAVGFTQIKNAGGLKPALVSIEDGWQLGYLLESLENGWVAVFLPQAPTPMSGNVMYLPTDRVRPLDISMISSDGGCEGPRGRLQRSASRCRSATDDGQPLRSGHSARIRPACPSCDSVAHRGKD